MNLENLEKHISLASANSKIDEHQMECLKKSLQIISKQHDRQRAEKADCLLQELSNIKIPNN